MENNQWEQALKRMQGTTGPGGASTSPSPGKMGNVPYAPGMMNFNRPTVPKARDVMGTGSAIPQTPGQYQPGAQPSVGSSGSSTQGSMPSIPPQIARSIMAQIMDAIDAHLSRNNRMRGPTY